MSDNKKFELTLKWGTFKGYSGLVEGTPEDKLLDEYFAIGSSMSAMTQRDTPRQKEILKELCDISGQVYLSWDDEYVSAAEAKAYIDNYGKKT